ncbi:MAG: hypothetical protein ACKPJD_22980, partial [Planctomycetaceae bacterium]
LFPVGGISHARSLRMFIIGGRFCRSCWMFRAAEGQIVPALGAVLRVCRGSWVANGRGFG